jgi:hypothetical protein
MIKPFFELPTINHYKAYLNSLPQRKEVKGKEVILLELTKGSAIVIV